MKSRGIFLLVVLFIVTISCSEKEESIISKEDTIITYLNGSNLTNQLVSETYMGEYDASTYVYGKTGSSGELEQITSVAYQETDSNTTYYYLLDELQRVSEVYSVTGGVKDSQVQSFIYAEESLVNYIIKERNWETGGEEVVHFSTIEIDGDNYFPNVLLGKGSIEKRGTVDWSVVVANIKAAGAVALSVLAGVLIAKTWGVVAALTAALVWTGAAFADEAPVTEINPNAPEVPVTIENICVNSNLEVVIGVDSGNVLTAIVTNGTSSSYTFYWSTGETATALASHTITAPNNDTVYLLVVDENGCTVFASVDPSDISEKDISVVGKTLTLSVDSYCINGTSDDGFDNYDDIYDDIISFNEDGTMTFVIEQPDNIITNSYVQDGDNLTLTLSQRKFFSEFNGFGNSCNGQSSFIRTFSASLTYDYNTSSFVGTMSETRPETSGVNADGITCYFSSLNCSGTASMQLE